MMFLVMLLGVTMIVWLHFKKESIFRDKIFMEFASIKLIWDEGKVSEGADETALAGSW